MTSSPILGQRVTSAICADDILPEGQAVIVRIFKSGNRTKNPPAVVIRYYPQSVASSSPQTSDGNWLVKVERFVTPLSASFTSRLLRPRGTFAGIKNFCRLLVGWSFGALAQPAKQSSRRFTQSLHSSVAPAFHEQKQTRLELGNVRKSRGEIRNVEC